MNIIVIAALSLVTAALIIILKQIRPDFALIVSVVFGVVIIMFLIDPISEAITSFGTIASGAGLSRDVTSILLKVIGISFIAEFASSICSDAGQNAISSKVEVAAKIIMLVLALPLITDVLDIIYGIL